MKIWVLDLKKDWDKSVVSEMYSNIYVFPFAIICIISDVF